MTDRIRSGTAGPKALLFRLHRAGGRLHVGKGNGDGARGSIGALVAFPTAAALVRRGQAAWFISPDGCRAIEITEAGRKVSGYGDIEP